MATRVEIVSTNSSSIPDYISSTVLVDGKEFYFSDLIYAQVKDERFVYITGCVGKGEEAEKNPVYKIEFKNNSLALQFLCMTKLVLDDVANEKTDYYGWILTDDVLIHNSFTDLKVVDNKVSFKFEDEGLDRFIHEIEVDNPTNFVNKLNIYKKFEETMMELNYN